MNREQDKVTKAHLSAETLADRPSASVYSSGPEGRRRRLRAAYLGSLDVDVCGGVGLAGLGSRCEAACSR